MNTCIFTKKFDALINGTLTQEEHTMLSDHLGQECESCEVFLSQAEDEKRITLFALLEDCRQQQSQNFSYNEAKKNSILREIISQKRSSRFAFFLQKIFSSFTRPAFAAVFIAVFALSFVFMYLTKEISETPYTGIKGDNLSSIMLTAQFGTMNGEERKIQGFIENNITLSRNNDLFFSFQLKTEGYLYLIEKAQNKMNLIYPEKIETSLFMSVGTQDLTMNNRLAAYSLAHIDEPNVSFCAYIVKKKIRTLDESQKEDTKSCVTILLTK